MLKTKVHEASRKSRSMDDILNSEDEDGVGDSPDYSPLSRLPPNCGSREMLAMFENIRNRCRGASDPYQSNSSLSSSSSRNSLHGSLEIIQVN